MAFGGAGFVNDALEQPANRAVAERPLIVVFGILQDFPFAVRLIEWKMLFLFKLADFQRASGTLVEELDQLAVEFVDAAAEIGEGVHAIAPLSNRREIPRSLDRARNDGLE